MLVRHWLYQTNDKINGEALTRELRYRLALGKMYGFQRHWNIRHTNQNHYTTINQSSFFLLILISLQNKTPILNKMPLKYFFIFFLAPPPPLPSTVRPVAPFQILLLLIYYQVQTSPPLLTCHHLIYPNISGIIYHYYIVYLSVIKYKQNSPYNFSVRLTISMINLSIPSILYIISIP
jgi:hypothetical protein